MSGTGYSPALEKILREAGVTEVVYTTGEMAKVFGKSRQWVIVTMRRGMLLNKDEQPIQPRQEDGQYLWSAEDIKWIAVARYRRRKMSMDELKRVIRRLVTDTGAIDRKYLIEGSTDE